MQLFEYSLIWMLVWRSASLIGLEPSGSIIRVLPTSWMVATPTCAAEFPAMTTPSPLPSPRPQFSARRVLSVSRRQDRAGTLDVATAARLPAPGLAMPSGFEFDSTGQTLWYLKSEGTELDQVVWRFEVTRPQEPPRVVTRPPDRGDTDANLPLAEQLRRERQRQRVTGVSRFLPAPEGHRLLIPLQGDLYLQEGDGPLQRLTNTESPELDPQWSPRGDRVAFVRDGELVVLDLTTRRETALTAGAEEGMVHGLAEFIAQEELGRSSGFWWSPQGSKLAYQITDERHIPPLTIVYPAADESDPRRLETHRYPFAGEANARVALAVVPVNGGPARRLDLAVGMEDFYLARVDWETETRVLVQTLSRDQTRLVLSRHHLDCDPIKVEILIDERQEPWINLHDDLRVIEETGELLWTSERTGYRHLELRDAQGRLVRVLTAGEWMVDEVVHVDAARREVWFTAWSGLTDPTGSGLFRVSLDGQGPSNDGPPSPQPVPTGHEGMLTSVVVAPDASKFVAVGSRLDRPPTAVLYDRQGHPLATLADGRDDPRLEALGLVPPVPHRFEHDGWTFHGLLYRPRSNALQRDGLAPLVVMLYGGPHAQYVQNSWNQTADLVAQLLAERGFAVWKMDNRGSARRGRGFEAALHRRMGSVEVADQVAGVAYLLNHEPGLDGRRVGVYGWSYGGYLTLKCLMGAPETFHAGVAVAPVFSWDGYDTAYTERYMGTPHSNPEGYRASSVASDVERLEGALLVLHGMIDENVHFRHTARLTAALIAAGKPFQVMPYPEGRHSIRKPEERRDLLERLVVHFENALGPCPPRGSGSSTR
ncbi:peptidase S9B dipeptidylpeptidase IV domain protein [Isosphaera pallida ATCC 43644]|uniref:Peptidase S9B dipeptidylpeptidase IV domain protein n=2 Tax=Isosphaera pallida TaxID=128 RepID=E8R5E4_ISOPI|nr:peptidase S9B dipeptidylpeptidase IV domain protein [Isosphaera pallida ATCC 43644]